MICADERRVPSSGPKSISSFHAGRRASGNSSTAVTRPTRMSIRWKSSQLALTGQHFIISYNEENGTLPGFVEGFNNVARDEHRHVAFGARFLREMAQADERYREAIQRTLVECGPAADGVLAPPWYEEGQEVFGVSLEETRAFAMKALERRLKVIGLAPVA